MVVSMIINDNNTVVNKYVGIASNNNNKNNGDNNNQKTTKVNT
jgi:hypothetical protein